MKDPDLVFQHRDAKAAENSLQNHSRDREQAERLNDLTIFNAPNPERESDGEQSDGRSDQAMRVLK